MLEKAITSPQIRLRLSPLPAASAAKRKPGDDEENVPASKKLKVADGEVSKLQTTIDNLQGQIRNL